MIAIEYINILSVINDIYVKYEVKPNKQYELLMQVTVDVH